MKNPHFEKAKNLSKFQIYIYIAVYITLTNIPIEHTCAGQHYTYWHTIYGTNRVTPL